jgi:6-phosphofructokinase 1
MGIKGNLVVGQSGGPTAVINNSLVGVIQEAKERSEIGGIYGMLHGIRGVLDEEFIDLRQESEETIETLRNTPASALGTVRYKVKPADYDRLIEVFKKFDIRYFFYVGGNDSMDTTHKIHEAALRHAYELHAIGVPKTVDNDLVLTDHCPGYGSAGRFVVSAIRNTAYDTEAMGDSGPIKIMEVMGRDAGWLTASAALAKESPDDAPHLIYLPECFISAKQVAEDVRTCYERYGVCIIAASEGMRNEDGEPFGEAAGPVEVDAFGHKSKGGVAERIADIIKAELDLRARIDKPSYLQRSFAELQSRTDRDEAYRVGRAAVQAAIEGKSGYMVTLVREPGPEYHCSTGLAPLRQVANAVRTVPKEFINEQCNGITPAFWEYARPLIGGNLPKYARLAKHLVAKV